MKLYERKVFVLNVAIRLVMIVFQFVIITFFYTQIAKPKYSLAVMYTVPTIIYPVYYLIALNVFKIKLDDNRLAIGTNIIIILLIFFCYKDSVLKKIWMYILMFLGMLVSELVIVTFTENVFKINMNSSAIQYSAYDIAGNVMVYDLLLIVYLVLMSIISFAKSRMNILIKGYGLMILFLLFHTGSFMAFCITVSDNPIKSTVLSQFAFQIFYIILLFVVFYVAKQSYKIMKEAEQLRYLKEKQDTDYKYYQLASDKYKEISKIRHDTKNQLQTIKYLIADGEKSKADSMVAELDDYLDSTKTVQYCDNAVINAVLMLKLNENCNDIDTKILIKDTGSLPLSEYEECSLFSNLFDNAIESCKKIEDESKRFIEIKSAEKSGFFILKVSNTYVKMPEKKKNGKYETSKKGKGHGYGMSIIDEIVKKYNGVYGTYEKEDMFVSQISIPLSE